MTCNRSLTSIEAARILPLPFDGLVTRMRKSRRLLVLLVLPAIAVATPCCFFWPHDAECPIRREGYRALRPGLSEKEVNDFLGVPPGNYTSGPVAAVNPPLGIIGASPGPYRAGKSETWFDDKTGVHVDYDDQGKLVRAFAWSHSRSPLRDGLRALLGW
jgi:hypothetical protein